MILKLPWPPRTGNQTTRYGRGRFYTSDEIKRYREIVRAEFLSSGQRPLGAHSLSVRFDLFPRSARGRVDYDNIEKVVNDALVRAGAMRDDSLIIHAEAFKFGPRPPRGLVIVELKEFEGDRDAIGEARLCETAGHR